MLLPSIIGEFVEPISTCQLNWPVFKLKEKVELRVEKIMLLLNITIFEDLKKSVSWAYNEPNVLKVQ